MDVATNKKYNLKLPKPEHDQIIDFVESQIPSFLSIIFGFTTFYLGIVLACTGDYYLTQVLQVITSFLLALIFNLIIVKGILKVDSKVVAVITYFIIFACLACFSKRIAQFCLPYAIPFFTSTVYLGFLELTSFYIVYIPT